MGGFGSGYPDWRKKKGRVEQSLVLSIQPISSMSLTVECHNSDVLAWSKRFRWPDKPLKGGLRFLRKLPLQYVAVCEGQWRPVQLMFTLEATKTGSGGLRWWFRCPLANCTRRAAKLYLPVNAPYFGCRDCHQLTYRSVQEHDQRVSLLRQDGNVLNKALETINSPRPDPRKFRLACRAAGIWDQLQTNMMPFIEELARMPAEDRLRRALATLLNGSRPIDVRSMSGFFLSHAPCGLKAEKFQSGNLKGLC